MKKVFARFRLKGLRLKAKKCRFGLPRIEYVGRVVDKDGLSMSKEKIETVLNFSIPKNLTLLRSFLGLANYFRQFVPMHSTLVKPMQDMMDHSAPRRSAVVWTQKSTNAFVDTKIAISRCPLMYFIDDNKLDIRLYTDASDFGIGGVLFQVVGAIWQPIAFISKSLTPTQIRWSTIQKEAYAIFYRRVPYVLFTFVWCGVNKRVILHLVNVIDHIPSQLLHIPQLTLEVIDLSPVSCVVEIATPF